MQYPFKSAPNIISFKHDTPHLTGVKLNRDENHAGKIALTGANGFVAKNLRKTLQSLGVQTVCIARKNFKAGKKEIKIISPEYSMRQILPVIKNCTAMIHLAGSGRQTVNADYHDSNVFLTKKMTQLCNKAKIKRFVYNSGLGALPNSATGYFISKYQAEQIIKQSGLDYVIFRPSYIIGGKDALIKTIKSQNKRRRIAIPGSGRYRMQPIYVNDVCSILYEAAILKKYSKKTLDMVGPEIVSFENFIRKIAGKQRIIKTNLEDEYRLSIRGKKGFGFDDLSIMVGDYVGKYRPLERIYGRPLAKLDKILESSSFT